MEASKQ